MPTSRYRTPKLHPTKSGLRSWLRRHKRHRQAYPPGQELRFLYREVNVKVAEGIRTLTAEMGWLRG